MTPAEHDADKLREMCEAYAGGSHPGPYSAINDIRIIAAALLSRLSAQDGVRDAVIEECARLYESINPASDDERLKGSPGAGAMGAVLDYRDAIRVLKSQPAPKGER